MICPLRNTEIVVISSKKIDKIFTVGLDEVNVTTTSTIQNLQIIVDQKLTFWEYVKMESGNPRKLIRGLGKLMTYIRKPFLSRQNLLMTTIVIN